MARSPENEALRKIEVFERYKGNVFGNLTVKELVEEEGKTKVKCVCICGAEKVTLLTSLKSGNTKSCGCTGKLKLNEVYYTKSHNHPYKFLGYEKVYSEKAKAFRSKGKVQFLNTGNVELFIPTHVRDGGILDKMQPVVANTGYLGKGVFNSKTKIRGKIIYGTWNSMLQRCYNPKDWRYSFYGGRGVSVCENWWNFQNFAEWFVDNLSLLPENFEYQMDKDLKNCGKVYSPESCIFVPKSLNVALQMERPCSNEYGVGIRFIEGTGKFCAQVTRGRDGKREKITGSHRATLEEAVNDYIVIKSEELKTLSEDLLKEGSIDEYIKHLVDNIDLKKMLENYRGE
tara:strand:- start:731 stop:1759 length:1029 start_codon:yes stop_codon:yes gene_type:complete